jgi:hypothetical protein
MVTDFLWGRMGRLGGCRERRAALFLILSAWVSGPFPALITESPNLRRGFVATRAELNGPDRSAAGPASAVEWPFPFGDLNHIVLERNLALIYRSRPVFRLALLDYQDFPSHDATRISSRAAAESRLLEETYEHVQ